MICFHRWDGIHLNPHPCDQPSSRAEAEKPSYGGPHGMKIKLAVDKSRNRVLFADAGSDFVDVLLTFLYLPLSVVQYSLGSSSPGCLSGLGDSVEPPEQNCCYTDRCWHYKSFIKDQEGLQAQNKSCECWEVIGRLIHMYYSAGSLAQERFVISDGLTIKPASTSTILSLLADGIGSGFEEVEVSVSWCQVVCMLKAALSSNTVLSDAFLSKETGHVTMSPSISQDVLNPCSQGPDSLPQINIKLFFDKHEKKIIYAECKHEFVDLLLSLLTCPLYSVIVISASGAPSHIVYASENPFEFVHDRMYIIEDSLLIYQASAMALMKLWDNDKDKLIGMDVTMNKQEAVRLVRAVVSSRTALTDVFRSRMEEAFEFSDSSS
ncbi:hypothetical protein ACP4OV_022527 [Aristida adscensionis]